MALTPEASELARTIRASGIKSGHAYDIASGRRRPSEKLAVQLFRATGLKLGPVAEMPDSDIEALARIKGL